VSAANLDRTLAIKALHQLAWLYFQCNSPVSATADIAVIAASCMPRDSQLVKFPRKLLKFSRKGRP